MVMTNMTRSFQEHLAINRIRCECVAIADARLKRILGTDGRPLYATGTWELPERHLPDCPCAKEHAAWKAECLRIDKSFVSFYRVERVDGTLVSGPKFASHDEAWAFASKAFDKVSVSDRPPAGIHGYFKVESRWERKAVTDVADVADGANGADAADAADVAPEVTGA